MEFMLTTARAPFRWLINNDTGTLAHDVKDQPDEVKSTDGRMLKRKMRVETVSFAAHVDYKENADFIKRVGAKEVVLIHGEESQMQNFKTKFERETREEGNLFFFIILL